MSLSGRPAGSGPQQVGTTVYFVLDRASDFSYRLECTILGCLVTVCMVIHDLGVNSVLISTSFFWDNFEA